MRSSARIQSIPAFLLLVLGVVTLLSACASTPLVVPDERPGDFRIGIVVMMPDDPLNADLAGGDARYIVDSSSVLRASFGAGSTLDVYPGYTRRLDHRQMNAIWLMAKDLLDRRVEDPAFGMVPGTPELHAGQPQHMVTMDSGTIIEIHMNARDEVYVFLPNNQHAASVIDAMADLAWVDRSSNASTASFSPIIP